jgi:UDP-glucose 4-epimerase
VYASSSSVYGNPVYLPIDEKHPTNPISPYGASKLSGEKYCQVFGQIYGVKTTILRYFTVFGPKQRPDEAIYKFTKLILDGKPVTVYGDGNQTRDFTYVSDIVDGTLLTAKKNLSMEVLNLGSGKRISVNELVDILRDIIGKKVRVLHMAKQAGDVSNTWAKIEKAKRILGYKPTFGVRKGIEKFVEWFKNC